MQAYEKARQAAVAAEEAAQAAREAAEKAGTWYFVDPCNLPRDEVYETSFARRSSWERVRRRKAKRRRERKGGKAKRTMTFAESLASEFRLRAKSKERRSPRVKPVRSQRPSSHESENGPPKGPLKEKEVLVLFLCRARRKRRKASENPGGTKSALMPYANSQS